jgi:hypothetical protein
MTTDTTFSTSEAAEGLGPGAAERSEAAALLSDDVVVCSFYTADDYYRAHGERLRENLERLGIAHALQEIEIPEGMDWADICRKKVAYLSRVCADNPDKKVFWIDVDCALTELPELVRNFTADLIGFQRGFASPLSIGYASRTRFWEPCFFGINATPNARRFVEYAADLERKLEIKATDDYFFEESWRANATGLSFQVIPSVAVFSKADATVSGVLPFFSFGSSGNVAEFKDKVVQHDRLGGVPQQGAAAFRSRGDGARRRLLRVAKAAERRLPAAPRKSLRRLADRVGVTQLLVGGGAQLGVASTVAGSQKPASRHRTRLAQSMVSAGQRGDVEAIATTFQRLAVAAPPSPAELAVKTAADAFAHFATRDPEREAVALAWWARPFPGNFGDWLSPLVVSHVTGRSVTYQAPTAAAGDDHLISIGSIGRFIKPRSIVVGTGISTNDLELEAGASYHSVRGPLTAEVVHASGGPLVESFGDPGILLSRIMPFERGATNGRVALVRHFTHAALPLYMPENWDEFSVLRSHPNQVRDLVASLIAYDAVVTSAMHVMIVCQSYGIPVSLITFEGMESAVHGNGMKYRDYSLGAGLTQVYEPQAVSLDLRRFDLGRVSDERVSEAKMDEVEEAVRRGVEDYLARLA